MAADIEQEVAAAEHIVVVTAAARGPFMPPYTKQACGLWAATAEQTRGRGVGLCLVLRPAGRRCLPERPASEWALAAPPAEDSAVDPATRQATASLCKPAGPRPCPCAPLQHMHWTDAFTSKLTKRTKLVGSALTCEGAPRGGDAGEGPL